MSYEQKTQGIYNPHHGDSALVARERPSLMQTLQQTHHHVEGLTESLSILESKLDPLLLPSTPSKEIVAGDRGTGVAALDSLTAANFALEHLQQRVNGIVQRAMI